MTRPERHCYRPRVPRSEEAEISHHVGPRRSRPNAAAWNISRRDFLRALGVGGASIAAVQAGLVSRSGAWTATSEPPEPPVERWRPPGGPTVEEKARELEYDVEKIFRFVADEVQYDPYPGVLRGATGTLWSRAGNAADQAMLLATMLAEAMVPTRFAIGTLDPAGATRLAGTARLDKQSLLDHVRPIFTADGAAVADDSPATSSPDVDELLAALPELATGITDTARAQLAAGVASIADALADAGIELPALTTALPEREISEHIWVQYADGPAWIDLDPTSPGGAVGDSVATAVTTLTELPTDLFHRVSIQLVTETVSAGQPVRQPVLTYEAMAKDLVGLPITVLHAKPEGLQGLGATITGSMEGRVEYVPSIVVGEAVALGDGRLAFGTGDGLDSVFGEPGSNEGETLAEWLELTVTTPSGTSVSTREIFDRVGYIERAAGPVDAASIPPIELVDLDADSPREFLPLRSIWSIGVAGSSVPWDFFAQDPAIVDAFSDLGFVSAAYHFIREALQVELGAGLGHRYFADSPNAVALVITPISGGDDGPVLDVSLDVLSRAVGASPMGEPDRTPHPLVVAGVLGHVAERITGGEANPTTGTPTQVSVGRLFEVAERERVPIRAIGPDGVGVGALDVSRRAKQRIAEANARGLVVIVPERGIDLDGTLLSGWWLVDPLTGATADELEDGRGVEGGEYTLPLTAEARAIDAFVRLGGCVTKYTIYAAALFGVGSEVAGSGGGLGSALAVASAIANGLKDALGEAVVPATALC